MENAASHSRTPSPPIQPTTDKALDKGLSRFFRFRERNTSLRCELVAGITTFVTMAYILILHPQILSVTGMDRAALISATAITTGIFCILMGVMANMPIALAPGVGGSAFFAYSLCLDLGLPWQMALGLTFYCGFFCLLLTLTGLRQFLLEALPPSMRSAITVGLGLFVANVGLKNAGVIVSSSSPSLITLGDLSHPSVLLALGGLVLVLILRLRRVAGAMLITILACTVVGLFLRTSPGGFVTTMPQKLVAYPETISPVFLMLDFKSPWLQLADLFPVLVAMVLMDLFGTVVVSQSICRRAGLVDARGLMLSSTRILSAEALSTMGGAMIGNSNTGCYIESAAGVEAGGRTGLTAVFVGFFFLLALCFSPLFLAVPPAATAPALILVGLLMFGEVRQIDFHDPAVAPPAILAIMLMAATRVTDGLIVGFLVHVIIMLAAGRAKEVSYSTYGLAALFAGYYLFLA